MRSKRINIDVVSRVAKALSELKDQMVFVGGAVVSLYADIDSDEELRETFDVDLTSISLINYSNYSILLERLAQLGFHPDPEGHSICSLQFQGIAIDIMPSDDGPIGPANRWYKAGFENLWIVKVGLEEIRILPAACFIATKFEAFNDRGKDYRTSHDIEDIIYVLDNRTSIVQEIENSPVIMKQFVSGEFRKILEHKFMEELLSVHLDPNTIDERLPIVIEKVKQIVFPL